jgi:hypothetical protein
MKLVTIREVISGRHVMDAGTPMDGLRDYYTAREIVNAGRIKDASQKFKCVQEALTDYRVRVTWSGAGDVLIRTLDGTKEAGI